MKLDIKTANICRLLRRRQIYVKEIFIWVDTVFERASSNDFLNTKLLLY